MKYIIFVLNLFVINLFLIVSVHANFYNSAATNTNIYPDSYENISHFSTSFKNGKKSRVDNITLASVSIDQTVVNPGQIFSFNEKVGPTTKQRGYKKSIVFEKGKEIEGYGGGVCQVSSTLYNAVMLAGLQVIERHEHSKDVWYVEKGKDAATSYGAIDFKFNNNKDFTIIIDSYIQDESIHIMINKIK